MYYLSLWIKYTNSIKNKYPKSQYWKNKINSLNGCSNFNSKIPNNKSILPQIIQTLNNNKIINHPLNHFKNSN